MERRLNAVETRVGALEVTASANGSEIAGLHTVSGSTVGSPKWTKTRNPMAKIHLPARPGQTARSGWPTSPDTPSTLCGMTDGSRQIWRGLPGAFAASARPDICERCRKAHLDDPLPGSR